MKLTKRNFLKYLLFAPVVAAVAPKELLKIPVKVPNPLMEATYPGWTPKVYGGAMGGGMSDALILELSLKIKKAEKAMMEALEKDIFDRSKGFYGPGITELMEKEETYRLKEV